MYRAADLGHLPPPPPLPKYDPSEEAPKYDWGRLSHNLPVDKGPIPWTPIGTQPDSPSKPDWRGVIRENVIEYPVVEPYKFGQPNDPKYFWFDTPDYADPFKKLGYSLRFFVNLGVIATLGKGCVQGMKFTTANNIKLLRTVFVPWVLGGMAASVSVLVVANLRGKKDDLYNYVPAGFLFGAVLGRKNNVKFVRNTTLFIPAALFVKYNAEINGQIIPRADFFRHQNWSLSGNSADNGIKTGDLRFGYRSTAGGDPGRDVRTF